MSDSLTKQLISTIMSSDHQSSSSSNGDHPKMLKLLTQMTSDQVNQANKVSGYTALHCACDNNNTTAVTALLQVENIRVNAQDSQTPQIGKNGPTMCKS